VQLWKALAPIPSNGERDSMCVLHTCTHVPFDPLIYLSVYAGVSDIGRFLTASNAGFQNTEKD